MPSLILDSMAASLRLADGTDLGVDAATIQTIHASLFVQVFQDLHDAAKRTERVQVMYRSREQPADGDGVAWRRVDGTNDVFIATTTKWQAWCTNLILRAGPVSADRESTTPTASRCVETFLDMLRREGPVARIGRVKYYASAAAISANTPEKV